MPRCFLGCDELDYVGDEEVAGDREEESQAEQQVLSPVIVAADAYENAVLQFMLDTDLTSGLYYE